MDKIELENCIKKGYSSYKISEVTGKSSTTVRYWLKKYGLSTRYRAGNKICEGCGITPTTSGRRLCPVCDVKMRRLRQRLAIIEYKGGKCIKCGDSRILSLDLHHRNSNEKEFQLNCIAKSWESVKKEADKCDLLCSHCHRIEHTKNDKFTKLALDYNGNNQELKKLLGCVAQSVEQYLDKVQVGGSKPPTTTRTAYHC